MQFSGSMSFTHPHVVSNLDDDLLWNKKKETLDSLSQYSLSLNGKNVMKMNGDRGCQCLIFSLTSPFVFHWRNKKNHMFGTTWRWVNNERIFFLDELCLLTTTCWWWWNHAIWKITHTALQWMDSVGSSYGIMHTSQSFEKWNITPAWFKRSDPQCSRTF